MRLQPPPRAMQALDIYCGWRHANKMNMEFKRKPSVRRPRWVWLIASFYISAGLWSLLFYVLIASGEKPLPPSTLAHFANYSTLDFLPLMSGSVLSVIAGVLFVMLRRASVYFFAFKFAFADVLTIWLALTKGAMDASRPENIALGLLLWGSSAGVCFYAWYLMRRGVLR